jgi:hypothetical protein
MNKLLLIFFSFLFSGYQLADDCGGIYRWDNKILIDLPGLNIYKKKASATTIHKLNLIAKPAQSQLGSNRSTPEQRKVTVTAWLVGIGKEPDGDYHLILSGLNLKDSLIAEIPDPTCPKLQHFKGLRDDYTLARTFIEENVDATPGDIHFLPEKKKVKITGIVFFDKKAHGNGHARNDIEIHPVLKIEDAN